MTTHILDVVNLIEAEDLNDTILVGHSYAGYVIAAASEQISDRVSAIVYLDSFVPADDDKSIAVIDSIGPNTREQTQAQLNAGVYGIEPFPFLAEQYGWGPYLHRLTPHPAATVLERVSLSGSWKGIRNKTFVWAREDAEGRETFERLKSLPEWRTEVYEGNHMIMIDDPKKCADILERAIPTERAQHPQV